MSRSRAVSLLSALIVPLAVGPWGPAPAADAGTATLSIKGTGPEVQVGLSGPAASLVGFEHAPRTDEERETLALAAENLKTGDALVRFNTQAGCLLEQATLDADPVPQGKEAADLGASYRFHCDRPQSLASAALGIFMGFPVLARVHVRYELPGVRGETLATPDNPVITFVPLQ